MFLNEGKMDYLGDVKSLSGNKGEWSEIYIFLTLAEDGKIYAADKNFRKIPDTYLDIIKIIREEVAGQIYTYHPGDSLIVKLNDVEIDEPVPNGLINIERNRVWRLIQESDNGNSLKDDEVSFFLHTIHIHKLKAPSSTTTDIKMQVSDYKTGIVNVIGFSCKSERATLLNASKDNTNFIYKITGNFTRENAETFNNIFDKNGHISTFERMRYLHSLGCDLVFVKNASEIAQKNLAMSCGIETPKIIAEMLKYYYYEGYGKTEYSYLSAIMDHLIEIDPADYRQIGFSSSLERLNVYKTKLKDLLYNSFTGMRLGTPWNGTAEVTGGYISITPEGEVLAHHTCITDEFKDYLFYNLRLEGPSNSRHNSMQVYEENGEFYIKFNLQIRFQNQRL